MKHMDSLSWSLRQMEDLPPVSPDPGFRADLKQRLLVAHPQLVVRRRLWRAITTNPLRIWSMAATLPVLVGIIAFFWHRSQRTAQQLA